MDRMEEFTQYYRMLNEYVIFYELLYARNEQNQYFEFIDAHRQMMVERQSYSDEQFAAGLEDAKLALKIQYISLIDGYFNRSVANFSTLKTINSKVRPSYDDIVCHIRGNQRIDINLLVDCIQSIEQAIPQFSCPISK